jgi:hypothetical protein
MVLILEILDLWKENLQFCIFSIRCTAPTPGTLAPMKCEKKEEFSGNEWCGLLKSEDSVWKDCIKVN